MNGESRIVNFTVDEFEWLKTPYLYIHGVPNAETLDFFIKKAEENGVPFSLWRDTVYIKISETQREAFPNVLVGAAFGPCESDRIRVVIGDLPILTA